MIPITNLIEQLPWHANRRWSKRSLNRIDKIIVHQEPGEGIVEQVNNYHMTAPNHVSKHGCPCICYHYCIRKSGEVVQANDLSSITCHCKGENSNAIGIMLVGNFNGPGYTWAHQNQRKNRSNLYRS
ncbi:MAG: N-acetylmuramoyl-L-alanine amidase [Bacteroidota bacterium]